MAFEATASSGLSRFECIEQWLNLIKVNHLMRNCTCAIIWRLHSTDEIMLICYTRTGRRPVHQVIFGSVRMLIFCSAMITKYSVANNWNVLARSNASSNRPFPINVLFPFRSGRWIAEQSMHRKVDLRIFLNSYRHLALLSLLCEMQMERRICNDFGQ